MRILREKYLITDERDRKIKPNFFAAKDKGKGYYDNQTKNYKKHKTTMDYLQTCINQFQRKRAGKLKRNEYIPLSDLIIHGHDTKREQYYKVQRVINIVEQMELAIKSIYADASLSKVERSELAGRERQECIEYIGNISFTTSDMVYLLRAIESPSHQKIYKRTFDVLFGYPNVSFYSVIERSSDGVYDIVKDQNGGIEIYGERYEQAKQNRYFVVEEDEENMMC